MEFFYFTETTFHGLRFGEWKFLFTSQDRWFNGNQYEMTSPLITRLDLDPFERFHDARGFDEWQENRSWAIGPALALVNQFVASFEQFPPRIASFSTSVEDMSKQIMQAAPPPQ